MSEIITTNIISFKRLSHAACTGYKIFAKEYTVDGEKEYLVNIISNPKLSLDIQEKKTLKYNESQKWQLRDEINGVNSSSVNVYINHNKLDTKRYTFNVKNKMLFVHIELNPTDIIEVEYTLDIINYSHKASNKCEYKVIPIFERNNLIGSHNIL